VRSKRPSGSFSGRLPFTQITAKARAVLRKSGGALTLARSEALYCALISPRKKMAFANFKRSRKALSKAADQNAGGRHRASSPAVIRPSTMQTAVRRGR